VDSDAPDDGPGSLAIPSWVPDAVATAARALHADVLKWADQNYLKSYVEVLQRLVADPRMQRVWAELLKRRRDSTRTLLHPAKQTRYFDDEATQQNIALASLLYLAVNLVMSDPTVMTRAQVAAERCRCIDDQMAALHRGDVSAARDHEAKATAWGAAASARLVVDRDTGDAQGRCFAILFADQCRRFFGSPLYGVTAEVASVAIGRPFTRRMIRGWVSTPSDLGG
jgi:hypothetical protein